jgi:hypothetical protein
MGHGEERRGLMGVRYPAPLNETDLLEIRRRQQEALGPRVKMRDYLVRHHRRSFTDEELASISDLDPLDSLAVLLPLPIRDVAVSSTRYLSPAFRTWS